MPLQLQNDKVLAALRRAAEPYGIPVDMLRVGTALNHINPETGAPEFGVMDWISGLFEKDDPKIVIEPPFDDPAINAEEIEAARETIRQFPPSVNPILRPALRAMTGLATLIKKPKSPNAVSGNPPRG